jgi:hypothetical protein
VYPVDVFYQADNALDPVQIQEFCAKLIEINQKIQLIVVVGKPLGKLIQLFRF